MHHGCKSAFLWQNLGTRYGWEMSIHCLINCGGLMIALGQGERYVGHTVYHVEFMSVIRKAQDFYAA